MTLKAPKGLRGKGHVRFDCPWRGHLLDGSVTIRNAAMPNVLGSRCAKCLCMVYVVVEASPIIGADGAPLPKAQEGGCDESVG